MKRLDDYAKLILEEDERNEKLEQQLSEANKVIEHLKEPHEIVCDHYLQLEEHAGVVGCSLDKDSRERIKKFWDSHQLWDDYMKKYQEKK